jgi:hypothetical protein
MNRVRPNRDAGSPSTKLGFAHSENLTQKFLALRAVANIFWPFLGHFADAEIFCGICCEKNRTNACNQIARVAFSGQSSRRNVHSRYKLKIKKRYAQGGTTGD